MGTLGKGEERRVHERVAFAGSANVTTATGAFSGAVVDISRGGLALRTDGAAKPGEFVRVRLSVPEETGTRTWIDPDAVVVRSQPDSSSTFLAVTFVSADPKRDALIARLVDVFRKVSPEDRLRSGTRADRNRVIEELLAARQKVQSHAAGSSPSPKSTATSAPAPTTPRKPTTRETRMQSPTKSRELRELYKAALAEIEGSDKKKKKR